MSKNLFNQWFYPFLKNQCLIFSDVYFLQKLWKITYSNYVFYNTRFWCFVVFVFFYKFWFLVIQILKRNYFWVRHLMSAAKHRKTKLRQNWSEKKKCWHVTFFFIKIKIYLNVTYTDVWIKSHALWEFWNST